MNLSPKSLVLLSVVLAAGSLGGTAAYRVGALADSPEPPPRQSLDLDATKDGQDRNGRRAGFAPCREPARLEDGQCVTEVVRTVTVPTATSGAVGARPAHTAAGSSDHHGGSDDSGHHGGDDHDSHHGGDDEGDHHGGDGEDGHHGGDDDRDDDRDDDHDDHDRDDDHDDD